MPAKPFERTKNGCVPPRLSRPGHSRKSPQPGSIAAPCHVVPATPAHIYPAPSLPQHRRIARRRSPVAGRLLRCLRPLHLASSSPLSLSPPPSSPLLPPSLIPPPHPPPSTSKASALRKRVLASSDAARRVRTRVPRRRHGASQLGGSTRLPPTPPAPPLSPSEKGTDGAGRIRHHIVGASARYAVRDARSTKRHARCTNRRDGHRRTTKYKEGEEREVRKVGTGEVRSAVPVLVRGTRSLGKHSNALSAARRTVGGGIFTLDTWPAGCPSYCIMEGRHNM